MKGIVNNLRFWGITLHKTVLAMVATIAVMLAFFTFMEGGNFLEGYGNSVPFYLIMLAFISSFSNAMNGMNIQFPLTVSFGSTRKDSFIAMQFMQHLIMMEYLIAFYAWVYFVMLKKEVPFGEPFFMSAVGIVLIVLGLCHLTSAAMVRFGRTIGVIVYLISIIALVVGTVLSNSFEAPTLEGIIGFLFEGPWILIGGIAFDVIMMAVLYSQVKKNNLQFA